MATWVWHGNDESGLFVSREGVGSWQVTREQLNAYIAEGLVA